MTEGIDDPKQSNGWGLGGDRGYRRSIGREEGEPDVADVEADVLGYGVMLVDLYGLSDASRVPRLDWSDDFCCFPVHSVVSDVGMLDDGGFIKVSPPSVCSVFLKSSGKVTPGFPDINLTTFAWNAIDSGTGGGVLLVLVRLERAMEFLRGGVVYLDSCFLEDALEAMRGGT